jgi:MFS family permease
MTADKTRLSNPWLVLALLTCIYILNFADRFLISGLVGPIKAEFDVQDGFMGLLMGPAFVVLYVIAGIPIARLADVRSRIAIICIGCVVWSAFTALTGAAQDPLTLALARVGVGIGEAAFVAPAYSLMADYFRPERRGMAFAILGVATYLGQILGYVAGPAIAAESTWRTAFFVMAAPGILFAVIAWLVVREPPRTNLAAQPVPLIPLLKRLASIPSFAYLTLAYGFGALSGISFGFWGPTLFARAYGVSEAQASGAFALNFGLAGLAGMFVFGFVSDRLTKRSEAAPMLLAGAALLAATASILAVTWSKGFDLARLLAIPAGLLGGGWSVGMLTSLQALLPDRFRATATALCIATFTLVGYVAGPWLAGAISERLGDTAQSLRLGLTVTIPMGFVAAICAWLGARTLAKDRALLAAETQADPATSLAQR